MTIRLLIALAVARLLSAVPALPLPPLETGQDAPARPGLGTPDRQAPIDGTRLARIDDLVTEAIGEEKLPGAVVVVGRGGLAPYRKAFGHRAVAPVREPMTVDTIFDLASLTKVVATTTAVMILVEEGRIRLEAPAATYLPGFERHGKGGITVAHLLTHVSGLRPDLALSVEFDGYDEGIRRAMNETPVARPGERFVYSDLNFVLLGEIVARTAMMPLDRFVRERVFEPLGMQNTTFRPSPDLARRIAPTERCALLAWPCGQPDAPFLRGIVHDPTSRRMRGVAGHAGVFSTADDLMTFCRMLLGGGQVGGVRVLSPLSVLRMTTRATPAGILEARGLGWDIDSAYSASRGALFPPGSYGHTGFTGTSLWLDPQTGTFVIFLSNRVHPDGTGNVTALRGSVATVVAAALLDVAPRLRTSGRATETLRSATPTASGIDVMRRDRFTLLRNRRVGLVTNQAGRARDSTSTIDLLRSAAGATLVALFSPEHGIRGTLDARVPSKVDIETGLTIHSLYGDVRRPTPEMLEDIDTLVVDLPDVGTRFYTYATTMAYVMEEAAKTKIRVIVLDRPNPINGLAVEGPTLESEFFGFTGYFPMPVRHGLTMGELARLFNREKRLGADLIVVEMQGWRRRAWFDETGQPWVNPSPNMRSVNQATLYPGIGAIEGTNISVGRGTETPFEQLGAPWIDGVRLADTLNVRVIPGIRFYPVGFTPSSSKYAGERCQGVSMVVTDRDALQPVRVGLEIAAALFRLYPQDYDLNGAARLLGSRAAVARVRAGEDPADIARSWATDEEEWRALRAPYLLYR